MNQLAVIRLAPWGAQMPLQIATPHAAMTSSSDSLSSAGAALCLPPWRRRWVP